MGPAALISIAVCATRTEDAERLAKLVSEALPSCVHLVMGQKAVRALRGSVHAYVATAEACLQWAIDLRARPASPLVVVGAGPVPDAAIDCVFPREPAPGPLGAALRELLIAPRFEAPPDSGPLSSRSFRRKSDMIIGDSEAIRGVLRVLDRAAASTATVVVTGESGTGKELVARALHFTSPRARGPFVAINCAAIPESLFEAELFGHQRGAFTGAVSNRAGAFESADGGTLFLDEIGEMPPQLQAKLLRTLETGEVVRLGMNLSRKVSVRVVAATNRDLEREVAAGRFREDLYYRLLVCPIHLPPLRERPEDVPALVRHQMAIITARAGRAPCRLTPAALERILSYPWPGNVRELVNVLERAILLAEGDTIDADHLGLPLPRDRRQSGTQRVVRAYKDAKADFETEYYERLMRAAGGNVSLAAKLAQKTRKEIYDALKRLDLDATCYRTNLEADAPSLPASGARRA